MFYNSIPLIKPRVIPPLDDSFRPAVLRDRAFLDAVYSSGEEVPLVIALKQDDGSVSTFKTQVFPSHHKLASTNLFYYMLNG
jgi:site-specific recombinase XerD